MIEELIEGIYFEFDEVMHNLGSKNPSSPPPWVVTDLLDPAYFDVDQILERQKWESKKHD